MSDDCDDVTTERISELRAFRIPHDDEPTTLARHSDGCSEGSHVLILHFLQIIITYDSLNALERHIRPTNDTSDLIQ